MVKWKIMVTVRAERKEDIEAIDKVNRKAFGQEEEVVLVQRIRDSSDFIPELSLVAVKDSRVVGHILFSQIHIDTAEGDVAALSLAPMAVLPEFQNTGIGSQLVGIGLEKCQTLGHSIVIVIGHPEYYPRFGFVPARKMGLDLPFSVPDEAFMVCELVPATLDGIDGMVIFPPEFAEAM
jgi:putative acetyltransferase